MTRRYCEVPREFDLTGTSIAADRPVMVLSGHDCAFVPYNRWACDHLEEVMQPLDAWGQDVVVSLSDQADCLDAQPNLIRVIASKDDTRISFQPEIHEPVILDRGEVFETEIIEDVRVRGSHGISVSQLLLGQDYEGRMSSSFSKGDPSLSMAIPSEQWRARYSILSPETFTDNFVGIIAHANQVVLIDGRVYRLSPIEETAMNPLSPIAGANKPSIPHAFGVTFYGYAN